jgi:hypothetical protein
MHFFTLFCLFYFLSQFRQFIFSFNVKNLTLDVLTKLIRLFVGIKKFAVQLSSPLSTPKSANGTPTANATRKRPAAAAGAKKAQPIAIKRPTVASNVIPAAAVGTAQPIAIKRSGAAGKTAQPIAIKRRPGGGNSSSSSPAVAPANNMPSPLKVLAAAAGLTVTKVRSAADEGDNAMDVDCITLE